MARRAGTRWAAFVEVGVDKWNAEAVALYQRLGYRDGGAERGRNGDRILLLRRLIPELR